MRKFSLLCFVALMPCFARAETLPLDAALRATYTACVGIEDKLSEYKTLAGINTAVSGVGTGLGVGATVTGIVKASTDRVAAQYEELLEKLREIESSEDDTETDAQIDADAFRKEFNLSYEDAVKDIDKYESELDKLNQKSKKLGNWRTGLLAGETVTGVTGAVLAAKSGANGDIQDMVKVCVQSLSDLNNSILAARLGGEDVSEANEIFNACRDYSTVDVSSISKRAKGAEISSIIGASTAATGTIVSAVANSNQVRDDNTDAGKKKEKNLNTASNVLAGTSTVASAAATVFSGTQIAAIKRVAEVASKCEGVLK